MTERILTSSHDWVGRSMVAIGDKLLFTAAAERYENTEPDNTRHHDYLSEMYQLEMSKADAARRYARWCQDCAKSAFADEERKAGTA